MSKLMYAFLEDAYRFAGKCASVCVSSMHVVKNTHLPVCAVRVSMSHQSLNTDPMSCMWIGHFSRLWQLGGPGVSLPAWADSCSIPSPCPLTEDPCAASDSPECQHSCNYLTLTSQVLCISLHPPVCLCPPPLSLSPRGPLCLSVAHLHLSSVYVSHRLYFLQECWQVINFSAAEWELCYIVNILPLSHIHRHDSIHHLTLYT